jgi:hypothetical protein
VALRQLVGPSSKLADRCRIDEIRRDHERRLSHSRSHSGGGGQLDEWYMQVAFKDPGLRVVSNSS